MIKLFILWLILLVIGYHFIIRTFLRMNHDEKEDKWR
jgi:uncharacterized membrane protein